MLMAEIHILVMILLILMFLLNVLGMTCVIPIGCYKGGDLLLPSLGMQVECQPGDMLFFNSYGLIHANGKMEEIANRYRYSIVLFMHHDFFQQSELVRHIKDYAKVCEENDDEMNDTDDELNDDYDNENEINDINDDESEDFLETNSDNDSHDENQSNSINIVKVDSIVRVRENDQVKFSDNINATNENIDLNSLDFSKVSNIVKFVRHLSSDCKRHLPKQYLVKDNKI